MGCPGLAARKGDRSAKSCLRPCFRLLRRLFMLKDSSPRKRGAQSVQMNCRHADTAHLLAGWLQDSDNERRSISAACRQDLSSELVETASRHRWKVLRSL